MAGGVWLWVGLVWNDRVRNVLDRYGDRITDVSIFGWTVNAAGQLTQTFNPALLDPYRAKWPHIRWWGCFRNDGVASIFTALQNDAAARSTLTAALGALLDARPWLTGIDIDLERGGSNVTAAESLFAQIAAAVHARGKLASAALPALTSTGSIGGEDWVRYAQLGALLDHVSIMSYDFAWAGSAPGPVSPWSWMKSVYDWAASQIAPGKLSMGCPAYGRFWRLHDYPDAMGVTYRGASTASYAGARSWLDGTWVVDHPTDPDPQPHIGWLAFRDPADPSPWAWVHVYDALEAQDYLPGTASGLASDSWGGRRYTTRYPLAVGSPLWSMADQRAGDAGAQYNITTQQFRDRAGAWVGPKAGLTLTVETLKRAPDSAIIWDDDMRTAGNVASGYYARSGTWSQWSAGGDAVRPYGQARTNGGSLDLGHDFGAAALHAQARFQLPNAGRAGVHIGGVRAELSNTGQLRITAGGTVLATTSVTAPGLNATPGNGRAVVGLRIRGTHARAYASLSENTVPLRLEADISAGQLDGTVGLWASGTAWFDHLHVGDGWWYQPQEAVQVEMGGWTWTAGRIPRTGIRWDTAGRFRPLSDVEEAATRTRDISLDWDYDHIRDFAIAPGQTRIITIRPLDPGVWLGRIILGDSMGFGILHYSDAPYLAWLADRANHDYGLQGIAIWTLGQEDPRTWERLAGAQLT